MIPLIVKVKEKVFEYYYNKFNKKVNSGTDLYEIIGLNITDFVGNTRDLEELFDIEIEDEITEHWFIIYDVIQSIVLILEQTPKKKKVKDTWCKKEGLPGYERKR
jgi:hypothetical protein